MGRGVAKRRYTKRSQWNRTTYDWERWFSRKRFTLRRGEDYVCSQGSMAQQVRNAASRLGVSVNLIEGDGDITVVVVNKD